MAAAEDGDVHGATKGCDGRSRVRDDAIFIDPLADRLGARISIRVAVVLTPGFAATQAPTATSA
jgi:hypothetical protein